MTDWPKAVKPGDWLIPIPLWNNSTVLDKLHVPTRIMSVNHQGAHGTQFLVQTARRQAWMPAGWFEDPSQDVTPGTD